MAIKFQSSQGEFLLNRYPKDSGQTLRAWDAADEYILDYLSENEHQYHLKNLILFNDTFGALAVALHSFNPIVITDSFISQQAIIANLKENNLKSSAVSILNSLEQLSKPAATVIIKMTKSLDFLSYFIQKIRPNLNNDSTVIIAGMVKNMPSSTWKLLETTVGTTTTTLAKKKAKLIQVKVEIKTIQQKYPKHYTQDNSKNIIYNHANVFSKNSLDIGTRFLLSELPIFNNINKAIDLGCGNGIVGLNLAQQYPEAEITFIDESYMAVESAQLTASNNLESIENLKFVVGNCLDGFESNNYDLIVCNPPFHQSHSIGLHIALQMFKQSHQCLQKGGIFIVIANRHLPYFPHLKRIFTRAKTIASNNKFNLYQMNRI